ncbi:hypothetical protein F4777DRAFT_449369 [Nemania sp. FL0916]|nr:hypothetical protein F4777DRAFT_449369 [Nemania sp. FL0916]
MDKQDEWSDDPDELWRCYDSRCSLCRFQLQPGDIIAAILEDGKISKEFRFGPRTFWDDSLSATFVQCQGECPHQDGKIFAYHIECLRFTAYKSPISISHALAYNFEPSPAIEQQRRHWIQSNFVSNLKLCSHKLPPELAFLIAQYCIAEYAIAAISLPAAERSTYSIDLDCEIWAHYVMIDGVRYFASFANKPSTHAQLILSTKKAEKINRMYVAEDHLGVRQVYFGNSTPAISNQDNSPLWWRTYSISIGKRLRVHTDGIKIRRFECVPEDEVNHLAKTVLWLTPENRPDLLRFCPFTRRPPFTPPEFRMTSLICNGPKTTAYSACWSSCLLHLRAHTIDENLTSCNSCSARAKDALWLYMPMDEGEYISQIWKRYRQLPRELAILIVSNKGRVALFGPQQPHYWPTCHWTLLHSSDQAAYRMFFDISPTGIHELAFESPEPREMQAPILSVPSSPWPESTSLNDYFYTSAALENVVEVTPCEVKVRNRPSIIGLLFRYSDGRQAHVGQFRPDYATTPIAVSSSSKMWLSFDKNDGGPYVDSVGISHPPKLMSQWCLYVSWVGKLEWWFTWSQCKLYYQDQVSPATRW